MAINQCRLAIATIMIYISIAHGNDAHRGVDEQRNEQGSLDRAGAVNGNASTPLSEQQQGAKPSSIPSSSRGACPYDGSDFGVDNPLAQAICQRMAEMTGTDSPEILCRAYANNFYSDINFPGEWTYPRDAVCNDIDRLVQELGLGKIADGCEVNFICTSFEGYVWNIFIGDQIDGFPPTCNPARPAPQCTYCCGAPNPNSCQDCGFSGYEDCLSQTTCDEWDPELKPYRGSKEAYCGCLCGKGC